MPSGDRQRLKGRRELVLWLTNGAAACGLKSNVGAQLELKRLGMEAHRSGLNTVEMSMQPNVLAHDAARRAFFSLSTEHRNVIVCVWNDGWGRLPEALRNPSATKDDVSLWFGRGEYVGTLAFVAAMQSKARERCSPCTVSCVERFATLWSKGDRGWREEVVAKARDTLRAALEAFDLEYQR